jgi:hypothetical protein
VTDELVALQRWYADQCNGDWEHKDGVEINTPDNPGWRVVIDLRDTALESTPFVVGTQAFVAAYNAAHPDWRDRPSDER